MSSSRNWLVRLAALLGVAIVLSGGLALVLALLGFAESTAAHFFAGCVYCDVVDRAGDVIDRSIGASGGAQ